MADEKVTIAFVLDDRITKALKGIGDEVEQVGDEAKKTDRKVGAMQRGLDKLKGVGSAIASKGPALALAGIAAGAAAATAAIAATTAIVNKSLDAWGEQSSAVGAAADALQRAGVPAEELGERLDELNTIAGDLAGKTLFGDEAILEASAQYIKLTGDATVGTRELDTILGIAAGTQKEATEAAMIYAKAQKGDIGALKELTPLTVAQEQELNKLVGTTKQAELATAILEEQYAGLAQQTDPTTQSISNLNDALGDSVQAFGGAISESGALAPVLDAVTKGFRFAEAAIYENSEALQQGFITAAKGAVSMLIQLATFTNENAEGFAQAAVGVKLLGAGLGIVGQVALVVGNGIRTGITLALSGLLSMLSETALRVADLAEFVGEDGLAKDFREMSKSVDISSESFADSAAAGFSATQDSIIGLTGALERVPEAAEGYEQNVERIRQGTKAFEGVLRNVNDELTNARANVQKLDATSGGLRRTRAQAPGTRASADEDRKALARKAKAQKAAAEQKQRDDALNAANAAEFQQAELARLKELAEWDKQRAEATRKVVEQRQKEAEAAASVADELRGMAGELARVTTGISAVDGLTDAFIGLAEAEAMSRDNMAQVAKAEKARVSGIQGVGSAVAGAAEQIGASEAAVSAIKAITETAAAASATGAFLTTGNPSFLAAAGSHAFAAAQHAIVAGTSVASGPGGGGSGGGGSAGASATRAGGLSRDPQEIARINAEAIANALGGGAAGSVVINLDNRGSIGDMTNDSVRKVGEAALVAFGRQGLRTSNLLMRRTA